VAVVALAPATPGQATTTIPSAVPNTMKTVCPTDNPQLRAANLRRLGPGTPGAATASDHAARRRIDGRESADQTL
jgi:hypothetical protein